MGQFHSCVMEQLCSGGISVCVISIDLRNRAVSVCVMEYLCNGAV